MRCGRTMLVVGLTLASVSASRAGGGWWSEGNLVQRCDQWLADAGRDPSAAAVRLAELTRLPQRHQRSALALLAADRRFADRLRAVLETGTKAYAVDAVLRRHLDQVAMTLAGLLRDRASSPSKVRVWCVELVASHRAAVPIDVLVDSILRDGDEHVQAVAARALRGVPLDMERQRQLIARMQSPALGGRARIELLDTLSRTGSKPVVELLINQTADVFGADAGTDPAYRLAVLESLQRASLALRRRSPGGAVAGRLCEACRQLWRRRPDETGLEAATICLVWERLEPQRFRQEVAPRLKSPQFWRDAASEPPALRTWCQAVAEHWGWPAAERMTAMRAIIAAGQAHVDTEQSRIDLAVALTRHLPEWPVWAAVGAFRSNDPSARKAAVEVLAAA
ncbi:MAG TPA: hypothetical protein EYH34_05855, partial [Planctomycetes bacterium]|nr:hypothetical protein [Planctomycetota bacterium]